MANDEQGAVIKHEMGSHYRYGLSCPNPSCRRQINVDPYRLDRIYGPFPAPAFHMLKKLLRGNKKGHDEVTLVKELLCAAERWKQILVEDGEWPEENKNVEEKEIENR